MNATTTVWCTPVQKSTRGFGAYDAESFNAYKPTDTVGDTFATIDAYLQHIQNEIVDAEGLDGLIHDQNGRRLIGYRLGPDWPIRHELVEESTIDAAQHRKAIRAALDRLRRGDCSEAQRKRDYSAVASFIVDEPLLFDRTMAMIEERVQQDAVQAMGSA